MTNFGNKRIDPHTHKTTFIVEMVNKTMCAFSSQFLLIQLSFKHAAGEMSASTVT